MTEQEAIKEVKRWTNILMSAGSKCVSETAEAQDMAIKALEEVQQYRAIGTPEELQAAMEKQIPKKPISYDDCEQFVIRCTCGKCTDTRFFHGYCTWCGQKLDWSDEE